jgi:starch phosphorylase
MAGGKFTFSEAKAIIRASTVFTTHTPVIAGNENLEIGLVRRYLESHIKPLGLNFDEIAKLGFVDNNTKIFWLPAFAMHFSRYINGVSKQHGQIARKMWAPIFPESPLMEVPINSITNGVHTSWISPPFNDLFKRYLGPDYALFNKKEDVWRNIYNIPDQELWDEHRRNKKDMINFIRRKFSEQMLTGGYSQARTFNINRALNLDHLTIVFARRFAAYKRPALILRDKERFKKILTNPAKPVQMIFAGKAHPADEQSKRIIKEVLDYAREYDVEDKVIFLENYDITTARHLFWGADLWLNNPSQDMEASGTSGMKAAMNGVLHLSTYEGWWLEGYNGRNGWVITAGRLFNRHDLQDAADANQLYDLLEHQISEIYYSRSEADLSPVWIRMMKDSIYSTCRNFNINRALDDYVRECYIPSRKDLDIISENDYALLRKAARLEEGVLRFWGDIEPASFTTNMEKKDNILEGETVDVECEIKFGRADPKLFAVELVYIYDHNKNYKVLPMETAAVQAGVTSYKHSLQITNYGPQSLNIRIKPANPVIQDTHPELVRWLA